VPAFGSNAFLGAINIVTRSPYSETASSLSVLGGSQGTRRVEGRFSTGLGSSQTRVSAGHDQNDGSDLFNDGARSNYLNISSSLTPTIADTLSFQAGASDGYADRGDLDRTYKPIVKREHRANYQYLRWDHLADLNNEFKLSAYHNYLDLSTPKATVADLVQFEGLSVAQAEALLPQNPDFRLDNEHGTAELYDIELQHTYQPPSYPASLLWGLGHRKEFSSSPVLMQDLGRVDEERWRLFGNLELQPADQLTANLGAMLETSSSSNAGARLSPRAALNYRLDEQSVIRTAYSRAYRMPSLLESNTRFTLYDPAGDILDIVTQPDPDIGPEQIRTWEIGYYRAFSTVRGHLDLRIFHEYIDDAIDTYRIPVADMDGRVSLRSNNSTWENSGAEVQLRLQPLSRFWFVLNYAYINTTDYCQDEGPADGGLECRKAPPTPLHTASALLNLRLPAHWDLSLAQYYVDEVRWGEGGHRDAYDRTDVRLAREWKLLGGQRLSGALVMQNALGNKYAEFYKYNEFDQRTYLQLKLEF
jgi:iron complex outermembrane receptor protein